MRRCASASSATASTSCGVTALRPSRAASARAARSITKSARIPSTPAANASAAACCNTLSGHARLGSAARAATTVAANGASWTACNAVKACGSSSKASRVRKISSRCCGSNGLPSATDRPKRSSSWGRSSPSSGFIVPTSAKRAACCCEMPSRSTVLMPLAATSSSASTSASGSKLTSSTYSTPLWARATRPGAKRSWPSTSTASTFNVPTNCSRLAASGRVTNGASGSRAANARAAVDLAVPRGPLTSTPPMRGSIATSSKARCSNGWPTNAVNGNASRAAVSTVLMA